MERRTSRGAAALAVAGALLAPARPGEGALPVIDAGNLSHNIVTAVQQTLSVAQEVQMVTHQGTQIAQQVRQLEHELRMLRNMALNTATAESVAWADVRTALQSLGRVVEIGLAIPYTAENVAAVFQARFPGYEPPASWSDSYRSWTTSVLDTLRGTLASAGLNVADAASVQAALDGLRAASDGTRGRLEALQIGNQIASLQVEEMAKLRQLVAAQINAQNAYLGGREAKAAGSAAAFEAWVSNAPRTIPTSRPSAGLGAVPRP